MIETKFNLAKGRKSQKTRRTRRDLGFPNEFKLPSTRAQLSMNIGKNRDFRFLRMFSGEKDQLGESIRREAKSARLEVYVESLDRKKDVLELGKSCNV